MLVERKVNKLLGKAGRKGPKDNSAMAAAAAAAEQRPADMSREQSAADAEKSSSRAANPPEQEEVDERRPSFDGNVGLGAGPSSRSQPAPTYGSRQSKQVSETAVLLIEPLAPVCALEEYVCDRYGRSHTGAESGRGGFSSGFGSVTAGGDGSASSSSSGPQSARKKARIFLHGEPLPSQMSLVQALVSLGNRLPKARGPRDPPRNGGVCKNRFLVQVDEEDSEDEETQQGSVSSTGTHTHAGTSHLCNALWGRVHGFGYELIEEQGCVESPASKTLVGGSSPSLATASVQSGPAMVDSEFDRLVARHVLAVSNVQTLSAMRHGKQKSNGDQDLAAAREQRSWVRGMGVVVAEEALASMLQLLLALHQLCEFLRSCDGPEDLPSEEDFNCGALTSKLLRQLGDPLALCTGSVPLWCTKLAGVCRFVFPKSARRSLHQSCSLGLGRALQSLQQRLSITQDSQRRVENDMPVANIPRQKVIVQRDRILQSAVRVMHLHEKSTAMLEVEYEGEVGTGSGPTLEFFSQVAEELKNSEPGLFRKDVPLGMLFPAPFDSGKLQRSSDIVGATAMTILERFQLLGQLLARCLLDGRLVDLELHPLFWRLMLQDGPLTEGSLRDVDPTLHRNLESLRSLDDSALEGLCIYGVLPGYSDIELWPGGAEQQILSADVPRYVRRVAEATLVELVSPQIEAFRAAFTALLPLEVCGIWSEAELSGIVLGASANEGAFWELEHLSTHIKASHGYKADSKQFLDLLGLMASFGPKDRRAFLTFTTGAPSLPVGGFAGLRPSLTVVRKESPDAPATPDDFLPSVMTCANYVKLPQYSSAETLRRQLTLAMSEGQSAFLLS